MKGTCGQIKTAAFLAGLILACILPCPLYAQFTAFVRYTPENGLPGSEVLDMNQDADGWLWFASAFGICRFDGREFRTFTTDDGLPALSNTACFLSPKGQLWFGSYEAMLCYACNGQIQAFGANEHLSSLLLQAPVVNLVWINDSTMVIRSGKFPNLVQISANGTLSLYDKDLFSGNDDADLCLMPSGQTLLWSLNHSLFTDTGRIADNIPANHMPALDKLYFSLEKDLDIKLPSRETDYMIKLVYAYHSPGTYYIGIQNRLFLLEHGNLRHLKTFGGYIARILPDQAGDLWVSVADQGVMVFKRGNLDQMAGHYLDGKTVSAFCQDHQGGYWFAVPGECVYHVPCFHFTSYSSSHPVLDNPVEAMIIDRKRIIISDATPLTCVFTPDKNGEGSSGKLSITGIRGNVTDMALAPDGCLWLLGTKELRFSGELHPMPLNERHSPFAYQIIAGTDQNIWVVGDQGVFQYQRDRFLGLRWSFPPGVHPRTTAIDSQGRLWIGTFKGLYKAGDSLEYAGNLHPLLKQRITCLAFTGKQMWVGSRTGGVLLKTGNRMMHFTTANGLPSNSVNDICISGDSVLWVGTNRGLSRIISRDDWRNFTVQSFGIWEGLPAAEVRRIENLDNRIWLGTNRGLLSFVPSSLDGITTVPPRLSIEKVILNDHIPLSLQHHLLKPGENTLEFFYRGISFIHNESLTYRYRIQDTDTSWIITSNPSVRLAGLAPGQYCFTVQAAIPGSSWSEPPATWTFTIRKPFTATWWFILVLVLALVSVISGIFMLLLRNQHRKEQTRQALLLSEIKALRSQMNPHFIFNALNSIQYFILENAQGNANRYLTNFARLIRRILEQSTHNLITLEDELITIRLYIDLERMRFEHAFEYVEQIDPVIDPADTLIPPMLLQPFLENSIWHGLSPRTAAGILKLSIDAPAVGILRITMEDNGVGRKAAGQLSQRQPGHVPMGMRNVEERIALFNKVNQADIRVAVSDLYDQSGQPAGTKVELLLTRQMLA